MGLVELVKVKNMWGFEYARHTQTHVTASEQLDNLCILIISILFYSLEYLGMSSTPLLLSI